MQSNCLINNCDRLAIAKNMCNAHYLRVRKGRNIDKPLQYHNPSKKCIVCNEDTNGKGGLLLCSKHYKQEKRKALKEQLILELGGKCQDCSGVFHSAAYDFHHLGNKADSIANMFNRLSEDAIREEIKKCALLCANCHRIRHAK